MFIDPLLNICNYTHINLLCAFLIKFSGIEPSNWRLYPLNLQVNVSAFEEIDNKLFLHIRLS
jgi:hypothetical protein